MNPRFSKKILKAAMAVLLTAAVSAQAFAGGFSIYEQGARATSMAGAMVARPWDASAAFYNPAGLAMFGTTGQWRIYGGIVPVQTMGKFSGLNPAPGIGVQDKAKNMVFVPFNFYAAYQIKDNMAVALAITTPFGLGTEWKNGSANTYSGRFRSILGNIQAVYVSPTFSYKINDRFSAGVGIDYVYSKVKLQSHQGQPVFNGTSTQIYDVVDVTLQGADKGEFGFHIAGFAKLNDQWSFGLDYKHSVKNKYDGKARFHQIPTGISGVDASVAAELANPLFGGLRQSGNTGITFPNILTVGAAYKPMAKVTTELDFCYVGWKKFDQVVIKFPESQPAFLPDKTLQEKYKNTWQIRFGLEYSCTDKFSGRIGYIYDKTPAPTNTINPLLPDADRNDFSIGFGYKLSDQLHMDVAYMGVFFKTRSTKGTNVDGYDGIYNTHVNLFSLSCGYTFGK
jgi:long-chain fatty acid transport protein